MNLNRLFSICILVMIVSVPASAKTRSHPYYLAIAYSLTTGFSSGSDQTGLPTAMAASKSAELNCKILAPPEKPEPTDCKTVVVSAANGCVAFAYDPDLDLNFFGTGTAQDQDHASSAAIKSCNSSGCQAVISICRELAKSSEIEDRSGGVNSGAAWGTNGSVPDCAYYPSSCGRWH